MDVGVFEARNRLSELLEAAERGEETTVLRRGKPIAKIVPIKTPDTDLAERRRRVFEESRALAEKIRARLGRTFTHEEMISARDEGRR